MEPSHKISVVAADSANSVPFWPNVEASAEDVTWLCTVASAVDVTWLCTVASAVDTTGRTSWELASEGQDIAAS